ncbi:MAG: GatB/YqeY domain-containing protein, partial [Alphaproteobacteria bacterium]|nr:GatB/YqeY domain-containing protein [Alphaproteobacteria bacterium]
MRDRLNQALKSKMKEKDSEAVSTLRLILAALKDRDIAARSKGNTEGISDDDILMMLETMVKQRRESIKMYEQGGRAELAAKE